MNNKPELSTWRIVYEQSSIQYNTIYMQTYEAYVIIWTSAGVCAFSDHVQKDKRNDTEYSDKTTTEPVDKLNNEPTNEPPDKPTNEPTNEPPDKPTNEPTNEPPTKL